MPTKQNQPFPGHWSVRKEGWGWRNLPGISVLSRQADVTGQMAQWPRRSLTVFKLSIQFQNRFGLSESRPTCHTQSGLFTWLMFITCSEGPWTRAWAQVQHFTGQETWTRAFLKGFRSVKWSTYSRVPEGLRMAGSDKHALQVPDTRLATPSRSRASPCCVSGSALGLHSPTLSTWRRKLLEPVAVETSRYANELFVMLIYVKSRSERLTLGRDLEDSEVT